MAYDRQRLRDSASRRLYTAQARARPQPSMGLSGELPPHIIDFRLWDSGSRKRGGHALLLTEQASGPALMTVLRLSDASWIFHPPSKNPGGRSASSIVLLYTCMDWSALNLDP